jgi:hypothetical protein
VPGEAGEHCRLDDQVQCDGDGAVGSDRVVAHDRERPLALRGEGVGRVREGVEMERSGERGAERERDPGRRQSREDVHEPGGGTADGGADGGADDGRRGRPARRRHRRGGRRGRPEPREERDRRRRRPQRLLSGLVVTPAASKSPCRSAARARWTSAPRACAAALAEAEPRERRRARSASIWLASSATSERMITALSRTCTKPPCTAATSSVPSGRLMRVEWIASAPRNGA